MKNGSNGACCLAATVILPLALTGCSSTLRMLGLRHDSRPEIAVRPIGGEAADAIGAATRQGREDLLAGRIGSAVEQFQKALASGEPIGPAANGMGVAYARLGQFEQAHRFFSEAVAVDPDNEKYRANLALVMRSPLFAQRHAADFAQQVASNVAAAPAPRQTPANTMLTRVSRGEVALRTFGPAPAARGPLPRVAVAGNEIPGFKPLVRIDFADRAAKAAAPVAATDPGLTESAPAIPDAKPAPAASRTVHFSTATRGFKPLVRFELRDAAEER